ncbi:peptidoglycan-associated lipoprotein [Litorimonas taeanensis]|uniref:Peptidoglycan-associated lipoprotein n=1 Tax=Litorimonas taeanensis TaxID=568099 RepID=A0A420WL91_9PROT|nr:peptidoglycan-associated lipoprotein Pal [Litorimonas taeanensis]RKQ71787.1 peptidoglycan-associated lipoprotein [Litorimonas taeanensis]
MNKMKIILAGSLALSLAACATAPEPEPIQTPVAPQVQQEPEPVEITQQPLLDPIPYVADDRPVPGSVEDFAYQSGGEPRVYFGYDQFTLSQEARNSLLAQANWLMTYTNANAIIEGHADERGTREYNLALGARRAEAVKAFLVGQGVASGRLTTVSYGKERPIDGRSNEAGWARNRNGFTNITVGGIS